MDAFDEILSKLSKTLKIESVQKKEKKNGLCPARQLQCRPAQGRKPYNFRGTTQIAGCTACRFGAP